MSRKVLIIALLLTLPLLSARAQLFDPEHRLSVEVLAGTSPVQTVLEKYKGDLPDGATYKNLMRPAFTLAAVFDLNEKWTLLAGANLSRATFEINNPEEPQPYTENGTVTFTGVFSVRYSWLRREYIKLFSGVGFGMTPKVMMSAFFPTPVPSVTPIGMTLEFYKIYLTAEITAGGNSMGGIAGIGFRF